MGENGLLLSPRARGTQAPFYGNGDIMSVAPVKVLDAAHARHRVHYKNLNPIPCFSFKTALTVFGIKLEQISKPSHSSKSVANRDSL